MIYPVLYTATETEFKSNGIGILSDAASCVVTEELNGKFELEMQYPVGGIHYDEIVEDCILLVAPNPYDDPQPMRIYNSTKPMGGLVTFYAHHISYDLSGYTVAPFTAVNAPDALSKLKSMADVPHLFTFWTDVSTTANMVVDAPSGTRALLGGQEGSILDCYGGEYEFDRYTVKLHKQRGQNRGFSIRYGKNLKSLQQERNISNVYTAVRPYWLGADGTLVVLPEKIVNGPGTYDRIRIMPLDLSDKWEEAPTVAALRAAAESYVKRNNFGVPAVSLDLEFVQLSQSREYANLALMEQVELGDTVSVEFPRMRVSALAKVIATIYDVLRGRYMRISVGDARRTLASTIVGQSKEIEALPTKSATQKAIDNGTALITGNKGGYVVLHDSDGDGQPDEVLVMDKATIDTAKQVLRINKSGIGFSSNGYGGPYRSAWTLDGHFVADFIDTGTLDASLAEIVNLNASNINTGTLTLGGAGTQNPILRILNTARAEIGRWDSSGIKATAGTIGGLDVGTNGLSYSTDYNRVVLRPVQDVASRGVIYVQTRTSTSGDWEYPFQVGGDGSLLATKADISGTVTATSGSFTGTVHATDGEFTGTVHATDGEFTGTVHAKNGAIGGWKLTETQLYNADSISSNASRSFGLSTEPFTRTVSGESRNNLLLAVGSNFGVSSTGVLYANSADISGKVSATSGEFNSVTINGSTFTGTNTNSGTVSGGTFSSPTISAGTLSNYTGGNFTGSIYSGGTFSGGLSSATGSYYGSIGSSGYFSGNLNTCSTNGTSLTVSGTNGSVYSDSGATCFSGNPAYLRATNGNVIAVGTNMATCNCDFRIFSSGSFACYGSKDRIIQTGHYGDRGLSAYETPSPVFADYGLATIDETGECYIIIDPVFAETVNQDYMPTVFLTKYGKGDLWVDDERSNHDVIVICGTPKLKFSWETRYQQTNTNHGRLPVLDYDWKDTSHDLNFGVEADIELERSAIDYGEEAYQYISHVNANATDYGDEGYKYYSQFERSLIA